MRVEIPHQKLVEVVAECASWDAMYRASRRDIQRLVGRLQHVARCVRSARTFISRILAALRATPYTGRHVIPESLKADVQWFRRYAYASNGQILLPPAPRTTWTIECDASLTGAGAHSPTHYYAREFPTALIRQNLTIARLEALNLVLALKSLAPEKPERFRIVINTDNQTSQQVLSSGAGQDHILCACAREIWLYGARTNADIVVIHKPGKDLILADALSRRHCNPVAARTARAIIDRNNLSEILVNFNDIVSTNF